MAKRHAKYKFAILFFQFRIIHSLFPLQDTQKCQYYQLCVLQENWNLPATHSHLRHGTLMYTIGLVELTRYSCPKVKVYTRRDNSVNFLQNVWKVISGHSQCLQGRIQDFSEGGANPKGGRRQTIFRLFPYNCMKMKILHGGHFQNLTT